MKEYSDSFVPKNATTDELIAECDRLDLLGQIGRAAGGWIVWRLGISDSYAFGVTFKEALVDLYEKSKASGLSAKEAALQARKSEIEKDPSLSKEARDLES